MDSIRKYEEQQEYYEKLDKRTREYKAYAEWKAAQEASPEGLGDSIEAFTEATGIKAAVLTSAFWRAFKKELEENAVEILPDLPYIEWICDHEYQEENIKQWLLL